ncbi:MAG: aspartate-semialdehyde dehydrogenase [Candidatus Roizmanbacteria bacterium]|nr:MAG: aspartate-semialdehyde dehydrogenase [Candidatus Roizmanbacteria bacterium]
MKKLRVGILGSTGMVGQRFISLLNNHPWFEISCVAASPESAGKKYDLAIKGRTNPETKIPDYVKHLKINSVEDDFNSIVKKVDFVFSALGMEKEKVANLEIAFAEKGIPVISSNSAHRWTQDVPMIMPEINPNHIKLIDIQRKKRGWKSGLILVKPNCSIQSYVIVLTALCKFKPLKVSVTNLQAISGAGKTFDTWPEMVDNVIPFIKGEEEKSEKEPLKIWGEITKDKIYCDSKPLISSTCIRIPVSNGHMSSVAVKFKTKPSKEEIIHAVKNFKNPLKDLRLPSAPRNNLIKYFNELDRPQTKFDRDYQNGMGITMGRLREDTLFDWKFITLSHNTIRGAAGGAIIAAELLVRKGYIK